MKSSFCLLLFLTILMPLAADSGQEILERVDSQVSFLNNDFSAEYTIIQERPGQSTTKTVSAVFRRDRDEKYVIIILEPNQNKGQGYLKIRNTLWFYDPESRRFNHTSSRDKFQNSNARNSDFTRSTLAEDYEVVNQTNTTLGRYNCRLLELEANNDEVTYPFMKIWVNDEDLILKTEDYSLSRQLLRTTVIPSYQRVGAHYFPAKILIIDNLLGGYVDGEFVNERTLITISRPSLEDLPNSVFSKSYLESVSQ